MAGARVDLAAGYRLAANKGWDDFIYTHNSLRLPGRGKDGREAFLINPFGLTFDEITASNLLRSTPTGVSSTTPAMSPT